MKKLLFKENLAEHREHRKHIKIYIYSALAAFVGMSVLAVFLAARGDFILSEIFVVVGVASLFGLLIGSVIAKRYLLVYEDEIVWKKAFRKEKHLVLTPNQYEIRLVPMLTKNARRIRYVFVDRNGKILLKYNSAFLLESYKEYRAVWEYDIFSIGCRIVDETWEIK